MVLIMCSHRQDNCSLLIAAIFSVKLMCVSLRGAFLWVLFGCFFIGTGFVGAVFCTGAF